jgi:hypothetical protein
MIWIERSTAGQHLALIEQCEQLLEQLRDAFGFGDIAGQDDLVSPDQDLRGESRLDDLQELIPRPHQAHHVVMAGDEDLYLRLSCHLYVARFYRAMCPPG